MKFEVKIEEIKGREVGEIQSPNILVNNLDDGLDLLGDIYYQGIEVLIMQEKNFHPTFFDLSNGTAGEILQKFSNFRMCLIIVCDFSNFTKKSMKDFIRESNKGDLINFVQSLEEAEHRV
ncbi:protein of unknown function [Lishizhenia tianjinensis]|uniref:DUF4180 domain-containing protein n=1 Tax=Lishizhenia tianjinensis TaxID=477690 RepID=A0A1I6YVY9_9FLAO|nr:DUF4180 domain-containing protein [Lishizhenia tianjinensis]SFT54458.1 protein of unknown function [Lishizhenia tianjinensis]